MLTFFVSNKIETKWLFLGYFEGYQANHNTVGKPDVSDGGMWMLFKDERGIALPVVLMVMIVLSVLGTALWQYSTADTVQVTVDEKKMQAYYLARAGAEATAQYIRNNPSSAATLINDPKTDPMYMSDGTNDYGNGTYEVDVTGDPNNVKIESTGTVNDVKQTVVITLTPTGGVPTTPSNARSATDLDWLNGQSHVINHGTHEPVVFPVSYLAGNLQDYLKVNQDAEFEASSMYFERYVQINSCTLTLHADEIIFRDDVELNTQGHNYSSLYLDISDHGTDGADIAELGGISGTTYGKVYFIGGIKYDNGTVVLSPGAYYFPINSSLPTDKDQYKHFEPSGGFNMTWN